MGRSITALVTMLVAFTALAAFFVALDSASGMRVSAPFIPTPVSRRATPAATATRAPRPTHQAAVAPASETPTSSGSLSGGTATATTSAMPTATTPSTPLAIATRVATPTATVVQATATATATPRAAARATATPRATATVSATVVATVTGALSPPRYGALANYANNTTFSGAFLQSLVGRIVALTNGQRTAHGLAPLAESGQLDVIAASRSEDLIMRNYFDHYDPTGPVDATTGRHAAAVQELLARNGVAYTEVGENLISRTNLPLDPTVPQQVVQAWMSHPEHRANILHADYTSIGVGIAAQNRPDGQRVVITQVFLR